MSAHYSLNMQAADGQAVAFSTIFRQTPTDPTAAEGQNEAYLEEFSDFGESEYSGGLSGEPSAAHWADLQDN